MSQTIRDFRWAHINTVDEADCRVCGAECVIKRGIDGPTCWAQAIGGTTTVHDWIYCPHWKKDWHEEALTLTLRLDEEESARVRKLITLDLADALRRGENG